MVKFLRILIVPLLVIVLPDGIIRSQNTPVISLSFLKVTSFLLYEIVLVLCSRTVPFISRVPPLLFLSQVIVPVPDIVIS